MALRVSRRTPPERPALVQALTGHAIEAFHELVAIGVSFERDASGNRLRGLSRDRAGLIQPLAAGMIAQAALLRTESRRAHQRSDFPAEDDLQSLCHICFRAGAKGELVLETLPVEPS